MRFAERPRRGDYALHTLWQMPNIRHVEGERQTLIAATTKERGERRLSDAAIAPRN